MFCDINDVFLLQWSGNLHQVDDLYDCSVADDVSHGQLLDFVKTPLTRIAEVIRYISGA